MRMHGKKKVAITLQKTTHKGMATVVAGMCSQAIKSFAVLGLSVSDCKYWFGATQRNSVLEPPSPNTHKSIDFGVAISFCK